MDLDVGERVHRRIAQGTSDVRLLGAAGGWVVTGRAADRAKQRAAIGYRGCANGISIQHNRTCWGWRNSPHEVGERRDVIEDCRALRTRIVRVFRVATPAKVQAVRRKASLHLVFAGQWAILCEQQVGDTHLHVVGFAGKDVQRFVLRLPAETADGAIVAIAIESAGDAEIVVEIFGLVV